MSDVVANEVVRNTKFNTLKTKVNTLEKKIPDAATLIHINQYNTDGDVDKKISDTSDLVTATVLNTKISEVKNKIPNKSGLVIATALNTKISEVESKIPNHDKYITTPEFSKLTAKML